MNNPLDQFKIITLLDLNLNGINISFTNSTLALSITALLITIYIFIATQKQNIIPGYLQSSAELLYTQIKGMLESTIGEKNEKYIPFILSIFIFVTISNLLGMLPYSFSTTSHVTVTFGLAAIVFIVINIIGFYNHGKKYFSVLVPSGIPTIMIPFIFTVELFAYLARPISLSLRLAANIIAGHIMMKVIAGFIIMFGSASFVLSVPPLVLLTIITGFEIFIALLQAYIFSILSCVYLNDAVNLH